jgi:hypothetical protein
MFLYSLFFDEKICLTYFSQRSGFSSQLLNSITRTDLEYLIKVHIALGKELANVHRGADSVVAYQNALQVSLGYYLNIRNLLLFATNKMS